jgi:2-iminobutanoate/2-iminopropanoate deaminase
VDKRTVGVQTSVPLSKAVLAGGMWYLSGDGSIDPQTRELIPGDARAQTRKTLENLGATLESVGTSFSRVVKATVYLTDIHDYAAMNDVYHEFFPGEPPARTTVAVAQLPVPGLLVEIELVALP